VNWTALPAHTPAGLRRQGASPPQSLMRRSARKPFVVSFTQPPTQIFNRRAKEQLGRRASRNNARATASLCGSWGRVRTQKKSPLTNSSGERGPVRVQTRQPRLQLPAHTRVPSRQQMAIGATTTRAFGKRTHERHNTGADFLRQAKSRTPSSR